MPNVRIAVGHGDSFRFVTVEGERFGIWTVSEAITHGRGYAITHDLSGAAVAYAKSKVAARRIARRLDRHVPACGIWQSADSYDIAARIQSGEDAESVALVMEICGINGGVNPRLLRD